MCTMRHKKGPQQLQAFLMMCSQERLLLVEVLLSLGLFYEMLYKYVCTGLWRFLHADALDHALGTGLCCERSYCFLCHSFILLILIT